MRVIGRKKHITPIEQNAPNSVEARDLREWYWAVSGAKWLGRTDLLNFFPDAVELGNDRWDYPLARSGLTVQTYTEFNGGGLVEVIGVS